MVMSCFVHVRNVFKWNIFLHLLLWDYVTEIQDEALLQHSEQLAIVNKMTIAKIVLTLNRLDSQACGHFSLLKGRKMPEHLFAAPTQWELHQTSPLVKAQ